METTFTYKITGRFAGRTVAEYLREIGYSSRLIVRLRKTEGGLSVGGVPVFTNRLLADGEILTVRLTEKKSSDTITPVPLDFTVLYEDEHLFVIDKPAGMPVHPSQGNHENTLANAVAWRQREKGEDFVFRAVNRLDRDTSGLILLAKNGLSSCVLSALLGEHKIRREYAAIACGKTDESGVIDAPIARKDGSTIERCIDWERGEPAVTRYKTLAYGKDTDLSFLRLLLETGRTHQIRVHMKFIGHPLPGDFLYNPDFRLIGRQALHSSYLSFPHPITGKILEFYAPLPDDMGRLFPDLPQKILSPFG